MIKRGNILARTLHKWIGLLVGIQVLIWLATGLYMVIVDIDFIHGDPLVKNMRQNISLADTPRVRIAGLLKQYSEATQIGLQTVMGETRYTVTTANNRYLIDPETSAVISPLDERAAREIATYHFNGEASISSAVLITSDPPMEIQSRRLPLWRVDFDDRFSTSFYVDPYSGKLVTRRHQYWRIFDFMWMLHIMDYDERTDAHNLLLITAQFTGLVFSITGLWLLFYSFSGRRKRKVPKKQNAGGMKVFLTKLHKWIGLLIGVQVLLWVLSGLMISLLDPAKVSGSKWAMPADAAVPLKIETLLEADQLATEHTAGASRIALKSSGGQAVYEIIREDGASLVDAVTGLVLNFSESEAGKLALQAFIGDGDIISIEKGLAPDLETRNHSGPYWRVNFSDAAGTSYYLSEWSGEILERRNNYWRTRDIFWMLHIMDYSGREDLNNSLIIIVALTAVWLGLSGMILLLYSFKILRAAPRYKTGL